MPFSALLALSCHMTRFATLIANDMASQLFTGDSSSELSFLVERGLNTISSLRWLSRVPSSESGVDLPLLLDLQFKVIASGFGIA